MADDGARRRVRDLPRHPRGRPRCSSRCCCRSATSGPAGLEAPEYFAHAAALGGGDGRDDDGQQPHRRVRRARGAVDPALRAGRVRPAPPGVAGGRHQVLRARLVRVGGVPLRRRARVRRHRLDLAHRHRRVPAPEHAVRQRHAARRLRAADRRARVQDLGGAVPHVDARRLPGRAQPDHRVHVVGHQGGGLRRLPADLPGGVPAVPHRLAADHHGAGDASRSIVGTRRRGRADRPQARAGVLVDRQRRLHPHRLRRRRGRRPRSPRTAGSKRRSSTSSPTRS